MDFAYWLNKLADVLVALGVPDTQGPIAALVAVYLGLTLISLLIVALLLRRNLRKPARPVAAPEPVDVAAPQAPAAPEAEDDKPVDADKPSFVPIETEPVQAEAETEGVFGRLRSGLSRTRDSLVGRVDALIGRHARLDADFLEELEEIMITADFGMQATQELIKALSGRLKEIDQKDAGELRRILGEEIRVRLKDCPAGWPEPESGPLVVMVVGVNGVGKTTTIGKLAKQFTDQGKRVVLGAGDTFRAAAAEQLQIWGTRSGAEVIRHAEGSDPAAVAFDAAKAAVARKADVLILDTAGRLHTKVNLMEELKKVRRVIGREIPGAPHETLLVLDATTGQNALIQAKLFRDAVEVSGIALTKLDGTAKGGIVVAISSQLEIPVRLIGVGEGVSDLRPFNANDFVAALFSNG